MRLNNFFPWEGGGGGLNRTFMVSTTPRGQKELISATTLSEKYDVLFHFFQVMPSTWAPALNDFVFTPRVADNCVHVCPISPYQRDIWADREVPRGKGAVNKVLYREAHPRRLTPYPDYMPFQAKNGYPFEYFLLTKRYTFHIMKSLPFHIPKAQKRYSFWEKPLLVGHYREYPLPPRGK